MDALDALDATDGAVPAEALDAYVPQVAIVPCDAREV
jgi:hypothetical protein